MVLKLNLYSKLKAGLASLFQSSKVIPSQEEVKLRKVFAMAVEAIVIVAQKCNFEATVCNFCRIKGIWTRCVE